MNDRALVALRGYPGLADVAWSYEVGYLARLSSWLSPSRGQVVGVATVGQLLDAIVSCPDSYLETYDKLGETAGARSSAYFRIGEGHIFDLWLAACAVRSLADRDDQELRVDLLEFRSEHPGYMQLRLSPATPDDRSWQLVIAPMDRTAFANRTSMSLPRIARRFPLREGAAP